METRECLLCLRIPIERIMITVDSIFRRWIFQSPDEYDQAVVDRVSERAAKLIASAYEKDRFALCGKSPTGLMAAAIYLSGKMEKGVKRGWISQGMIALVLRTTKPKLETTEVTIRIRARQINDILDLGIMEKRKRRERPRLYCCPFCEKTFKHIYRLVWHLTDGGWKVPSMPKLWMFTRGGILVDEDMLEELKRDPGNCEKPPSRPRRRDWRESPVEGTYRVTG